MKRTFKLDVDTTDAIGAMRAFAREVEKLSAIVGGTDAQLQAMRRARDLRWFRYAAEALCFASWSALCFYVGAFAQALGL